MKSVIKFLFSVGTGVLSMMFGGYVLSCMIRWFITPKFGGPVVSYLDAVGLMIVANFFMIWWFMNSLVNKTFDDKTEEKSKKPSGYDTFDKSITTNVLMCVITYPIVLLSAYVWHQFIQ